MRQFGEEASFFLDMLNRSSSYSLLDIILTICVCIDDIFVIADCTGFFPPSSPLLSVMCYLIERTFDNLCKQ